MRLGGTCFARPGTWWCQKVVLDVVSCDGETECTKNYNSQFIDGYFSNPKGINAATSALSVLVLKLKRDRHEIAIDYVTRTWWVPQPLNGESQCSQSGAPRASPTPEPVFLRSKCFSSWRCPPTSTQLHWKRSKTRWTGRTWQSSGQHQYCILQDLTMTETLTSTFQWLH